ncbi:acetyl-CoA synthetase-like protein [Trametes elegans]|nr:acetyl-CoA synthetase-like protein [Trametes elegans]
MARAIDELAIVSPQGVRSATWTPPPFYGTLTIPELYAFHAEKSPEHPVVVYDDEQGVVQLIRYKEIFRAIRKAATLVSGHVRPSATTEGVASQPPVVGVLAIADSITLMALLVGVMYLGYTPFPISVRNSAVAVAHLVRRTSARTLFVSRDVAMQRAAHEAQELLANEGYDVELLPLPGFRDLYNDSEEGLEVKMGPNLHEDTPCLILHSSGSTAFPKPITFPHRNLSRWGFLSFYGDYDLCGRRVSTHSLPIFHVMGALIMAWPLCTGAVMALFRPSSPPVISTPDTVWNAINASQSEMAVCVPAMIEAPTSILVLQAWARDPGNLAGLRRLDCLLYAGAPLHKEVGERLLDEGVKLVTGYGLTEAGAICRVMPDPRKIPRTAWDYFALSAPAEIVKIYQDGLPGVFELVIVDSPTWSPNVFNTQVGGRPAYATSDLFEEHPANPNMYKVYGRVDDQIMLSTGEKTNPVPLEAIMIQDPSVRAAIIFGRGRLQNGVIIQPSEPFDPRDEARLEAFRNKIWPTVERANNFAPSHSRIFKEMITVTKPDKPFQYTAKGTPRRHVSLADYAEEIETLYTRVEETTQIDVPTPASWTDDSVRDYVRGVVKQVLKAPSISDDDDLFQQGCDSLQATWIRNTILHAVRTTTKLSTHDVPQNFVYSYPTIASLGGFLGGLIAGKGVDKDAERAERLAQMKALVEKYGAQWPEARWKASADATEKSAGGDGPQTVLITGTTGRLGSHLLAQLLQKPEVGRVYALNRGTAGDEANLAERQREAFKTWGLDAGLLDGGKVYFHPADLTKPLFGLGEKTFEEAITTILHNAWRVDFNVTLPSFEPLVAGTRSLLDLALSSPIPGGPRVLFVGSIAAAANYSVAGTPVPESLDLGPEVAVGQGYGESKWVTEQVLFRAAQETGLRTTSVRVGQLSGDTRTGGWNTTEWVPAIVRAGKLIGSIPTIDTTVSWVPVDIASAALLEILASDERILHLTAPRPASWPAVFASLAHELDVPLAPAQDWLAALRAAADAATVAGQHESAYALLPFFDAALRAELRFDTRKAVEASHALADMAPVGAEDVGRWVRFWRARGFLE